MKWFFLEGHKEHLEELRKQSIVVSETRIHHPIETDGIIFPEDQRNAVLGVVGEESLRAEAREFFTDQKNIFFLDTHGRIHGGSVQIDSHNCSCEGDYDGIEEVLLYYAEALCVHFYAHHCSEKISAPITDEHIHIFPYSAPVASAGQVQVKKIFGKDLFGSEGITSLRVRGRSKKMALRDPDGVVFGERFANNLYVYLDIFDGWAEERKILFTHILDTYFSLSGYEKEIHSLQQSRDSSIKNERDASRQDAKEKYARACMQRYREEIKELKDEISGTEDEITSLSRRITEHQREYENAKEQERLIAERIKSSDMREFEEEYGYLMKHPAVTEIHTKDGAIEIFTKTLVLEEHEIGKFKISLHFDGKFFCENLSYKPNRYDHPHISDTGTCFGESSDDIYDYIRGFHFAVAFHKIWERLNKYSPGEEYTQIENWPRAPKKLPAKRQNRKRRNA